MIKTLRITRPGLQALCTVCAVIMATSPAGAAVRWWVDGGNPSCSDTGSGSPVEPFCTIGAGARRALPGDSVLVQQGPAASR